MLDSSRLDKRQVAKTLDTVSAVGLVPGSDVQNSILPEIVCAN